MPTSFDSIYVIGAGGVGGGLMHALSKTVSPQIITIIDGDKFDEGNVERQLGAEGNVGRYKAEVLAEKFGTLHVNRYVNAGWRPNENSVVFCCVDNAAAKVNVLNAVDRTKSHAIIMGNEYETSDALFYSYTMKGTENDPRVKFPEILLDRSGDPLRPNCTGEEQVKHPQLAIFNQMAAALGLHLFWLHFKVDLDAKFKSLYHLATFNAMSSEPQFTL